MKCLKCGNENFNNNNFCEYCGANLKDMPQSANNSEPTVVFTDNNATTTPAKKEKDSTGMIIGIVLGTVGGVILLIVLAIVTFVAIVIALFGACLMALAG